MINNKIVIGIIGSRERSNIEEYKRVHKIFLRFLKKYPEMIVCSGLCETGADQFAHMLAHHHSVNMLWFPAKWDKYSKAAGFVRNTYIAECSDYLIALPKYDRIGGTDDTIQKFIKLKGKNHLILVRERIIYDKNELKNT